LLYVSNIPVILTSAVFADIYFIAQILWNASTAGGQTQPDLLSSLLGTFRADDISGQYVPQSGLVYFLTPPRSLVGELGVFNPVDPISSITRAAVYALVLIFLCFQSCGWIQQGWGLVMWLNSFYNQECKCQDGDRVRNGLNTD
jgi:preprotein translocase subunit SecY